MGGAVWKGARNSIWQCLRAWGAQNRVGLEASLVGGRAAALVRGMGLDAGGGMAQAVDASCVRAFERDLEQCRLCAGATKDGSGLGIVSYSPQGLAPWRWGCEVEMTKWNELTSPVAVGSRITRLPLWLPRHQILFCIMILSITGERNSTIHGMIVSSRDASNGLNRWCN